MSANDAFGEVPPSAAAHASMDPDRFRLTEIMVMVLLMMMMMMMMMMMVMMMMVLFCWLSSSSGSDDERKNLVSHFAYFEIQI